MSPIQGGGSREWLTPLDPRGNLPHESGDSVEVVGAHKGFFTGLNIVNPQAGYEYQWSLRNPNQIMSARQRGWRTVTGDDPEMAAFRTAVYGDEDDTDTPTDLDTSNVFNELVLMKIPAGKLRAIRDQQKLESQNSLHGAGYRSFMGGVTDEEMLHIGKGEQSRFAMRGHGLEYHDDDRVYKTWTPEQGIVEREG